jgi:hypothetical protein
MVALVAQDYWVHGFMMTGNHHEPMDPRRDASGVSYIIQYTVICSCNQLGPIPPLCLRTTFDPQNSKMYKEDLYGVVELMTLQSIKELLDKVRDWNMDDVVCLVSILYSRPSFERDDRSSA